MVKSKEHRRVVSRAVIFTFFWLLVASTWPLGAGSVLPASRAANEERLDKAADEEGPVAVEKTGFSPQAKNKKFPWLWVAAGAVVVAAVAIYLLTIDSNGEGLKEDFDSAASDLWVVYPPGSFTVTGGAYRGVSSVGSFIWSGALYNYSWPKADFTVTMRVRRVQGAINYANHLVLTSQASFTSPINSLGFGYTHDGRYGVFKYTNITLSNTAGATITSIKPYTSHAAVNQNLGSWNTLKVVKEGANYSYYINDTVLFAFADSEFDPRYIGMTFMCIGDETVMEYDYLYLN